MSKTGLLALVCWAVVGCSGPAENVQRTGPALPQAPAATPYQAEDPGGRHQQWERMLRNPNTGQLPEDIFTAEQVYAQRLPRRSQLRTGQSEVQGWRLIGPSNVGGRTRAAVIDRTNTQRIVAGSVSGNLYETTNDGATWRPLLPTTARKSITALAQATSQPEVWYYGTGELRGNTASTLGAPYRGDGIYRSTDNGQTWQQLPSTAGGFTSRFNNPFQYVYRVVVDQDNAAEVYAATVGGLWRSTDSGDSWTLVLGNTTLDYSDSTLNLNEETIPRYGDVMQTADGTYYATISRITMNTEEFSLHGLFRSADGVSWTKVSPASYTASQLAVLTSAPTRPNEVWVFAQGAGPELYRYTYLSGNGSGLGSTWEDLTDQLPASSGVVGGVNTQGSYNMITKTNPLNPDELFLGATNLFRSRSGFAADDAQWVGGYSSDNDASVWPNHYPDQHVLQVYPDNDSRLLSANDGGIWRTENLDADSIVWESLNNGYLTTQFYSVAQDMSGNTDLVIGGLQDNGTLANPDPTVNNEWQRYLTGDGGYAAVGREGDVLFVSFQRGSIYRVELDDQGEPFAYTQVNVDDVSTFPFVTEFELDPLNDNRLYMNSLEKAYRNRNLAQIPLDNAKPTNTNWDELPLPLDTNFIAGLFLPSYRSAPLYVATESNVLYKYDRPFTSFPVGQVVVVEGANPGGFASSVSINPLDTAELVVTFANYGIRSVFHSTDGGATWQDISGNLEENEDGSGGGPSVRWCEIVPLANGDRLFLVGTSVGLYSLSSADLATPEWVLEGEGTIGNHLVVMLSHRSADGRVVVASHGGGVYEGFVPGSASVPLPQVLGGFRVDRAFPNPVGEQVTFEFTVPQADRVELAIYNAQGQLVRLLAKSVMQPGPNTASWDGRDAFGQRALPGLYYARFLYQKEAYSVRLLVP